MEGERRSTPAPGVPRAGPRRAERAILAALVYVAQQRLLLRARHRRHKHVPTRIERLAARELRLRQAKLNCDVARPLAVARA
eukprot:6581972-Prymnesium_polylepis.1